MPILLSLLLLNILNFVLAIVVISYSSSSRKLPPVRWMLILVISFCVISFCTLGVYVSRGFEQQVLFSRMRFLTLGLLSPSWFLFFISIYGKWKWIKRPMVAVLAFLPGCITTLLILSPWHELVVHSFEPITISGFSVLKFQMGAWFLFHYIWAMFLVLLSVIFGIYFFIKETGVRRLQIILLLASSTLAAAVDIYCVLNNSPLRWVLLASGTFLFSQLGIVIAAFKLRLLNIAPLATTRVFNEFPDPVFVLDSEGVVRLVNKAATQFFGFKNPIGKEIHELLPNVTLNNGEISFTNQNGENHFFDLSIEALTSDSDEVVGQVFFLRKITFQKTIEKRLNENLEFKARLLSMIAHDFTGVVQTQAFLTSSLEEKVELSLKSHASSLADSTFASRDFIANVLLWAKTQENQFKPVIKPFEVNVLIKEVMHSLESVWKIRDLKIIIQSNKEPLVIHGDSVMIESVIRNLLTNAMRASSPGQKIEIFIQTNEFNKVKILIKDEGNGMSPKQLEAIQENSEEPFSSDSDIRPNGFGLGLAIARRFINLHYGKLEFVSEKEKGTLVTLTLPV